jgi:hypothetical protein
MMRHSILIAAAALLLVPAVSNAQFKQGDWELTLGGSGSTPSRFNGFSFGIDAGLGLFVADQLEIGIRQHAAYTDLTGGSDGAIWSGSTRVAVDFHLDFGAWQPFIGANIGYVYGEAGFHDTFEAAPEAGLKWFVNGTTFIYGLAEYQFFFDKDSNVAEQFQDGQFVYTLGIGFKF